uniref:Uncharacterized protein n=1 Tax=Noctiluca scintillans TaxID=2966 RepID=A0A7S1B008_NOCSC|mmetsp:Transcript_730/g.2003  ORF Transcript_730/g.2003 Transcript_730/m.2003 type:complete len:192 (+) Transcript_730:66-641(+)|eukprot:CAMPEP_0194480720 /NCGR_PEP_ID=MMETSP0253-20130528/3429_1 /TAXON_ID=2966 /ORGANISM="Noctiluca scintillans" /LENGTH=191 /DNA_ID=CAMNT_0039320143 /DNA_START=30 /DNA_END=605 /DNA_ORIENTATION=+
MVMLPMPAMPTQFGPPSAYVEGKKPIFLALLVFQTTLCVLRICMLLDILGGFVMALGVGVGWYAFRENMNITFICYWGMMSLINGMFDLVRFIDTAVHSFGPVFTMEPGSTSYNIRSLVMLLVPLSCLAGAVLAYFMYKNVADGDYDQHSFSSGRMGRRDEREPLVNARSAPSDNTSFAAFAGQGQRLGAV